ncbi:hypothetical protein C8J57DRAFT_1525008 [Mycena rebaudengoi]|nr:hypothetical protein C8J57DRAFT_1525008 [Mycena rebaudengoi]
MVPHRVLGGSVRRSGRAAARFARRIGEASPSNNDTRDDDNVVHKETACGEGRCAYREDFNCARRNDAPSVQFSPSALCTALPPALHRVPVPSRYSTTSRLPSSAFYQPAQPPPTPTSSSPRRRLLRRSDERIRVLRDPTDAYAPRTPTAVYFGALNVLRLLRTIDHDAHLGFPLPTIVPRPQTRTRRTDNAATQHSDPSALQRQGETAAFLACPTAATNPAGLQPRSRSGTHHPCALHCLAHHARQISIPMILPHPPPQAVVGIGHVLYGRAASVPSLQQDCLRLYSHITHFLSATAAHKSVINDTVVFEIVVQDWVARFDSVQVQSLALNAEREPGVWFRHSLNLNAECAFWFGSAFERVRTLGLSAISGS